MTAARLLARGFLGGITIGIGGTTFLMCPNNMLGAILFSVGLFTICAFGFALYTGATGYVMDGNPSDNLVNLLLIWLSNFAGCVTAALLLRGGGNLAELAQACMAAKVAKPLGYAFSTAILCGALMYIAVENYRSSNSQIGKHLGMFLCVPAFILSELEHSIANMFFFAAAKGFGMFAGETMLFLLVVSLGNLVGGLGFAKLRRFGSAESGEPTTR